MIIKFAFVEISIQKKMVYIIALIVIKHVKKQIQNMNIQILKQKNVSRLKMIVKIKMEMMMYANIIWIVIL